MDTSGQSSGPVVRTIKTRPGVDYTNYEDAVAIFDCMPFWRRVGFTWRDCQSVWFVKDICGFICAMFTWGLVVYAEFVVIFVMLAPAPNQIHSVINGVVFQFLAVMAIASHTKCMLTDPVSPGGRGWELLLGGAEGAAGRGMAIPTINKPLPDPRPGGFQKGNPFFW